MTTFILEEKKKLEEEFLNEDFLKDVKKIFMSKNGGVPEAILFILSCIKGRYATLRWINCVLKEAGIERENSDIRYTINRMKRKEPHIRRTKTGKILKSNTYPTIESADLVKGDKDFVDINDYKKIRWKISYKVRLNKYGEQKAKEIIKNLL